VPAPNVSPSPLTVSADDVRPGALIGGARPAPRATPTIAQLEASEKWAGWIQTGIAAAIFLGGMYFSYRESWIGTGADIFKVFVAAFTADFATEALMNAFKGQSR